MHKTFHFQSAFINKPSISSIANWSPTLGEFAVMKNIQAALDAWGKYARLTFHRTTEVNGDIVVAFGSGYHGDRSVRNKNSRARLILFLNTAFHLMVLVMSLHMLFFLVKVVLEVIYILIMTKSGLLDSLVIRKTVNVWFLCFVNENES